MRFLLLSFVALALASCEGASAQDPVDVTPDMLPCASDGTDGTWESAPWPPASVDRCEWYPFDGDTSYRFTHPLGRVPRSVLIYLSFDRDGRASAITVGDTTRIISVDENVVELRNGTNQDFFAKVVLQ